jgi:hypothetical protein
MSRWLKLLIGLLVTLVVALLTYGPLGRGAAYVDALEVEVKAAALPLQAQVPGLQVRVSRNPVSRVVMLCGVTNDFQRDGMPDRELPGIDGRIGGVAGVSGVRWSPPAPDPRQSTPPCRPGADDGAGFPLLAEFLILAAFFFLLGLGLGWLFRRRPPRTGYLS